jgi:hypothetical protein
MKLHMDPINKTKIIVVAGIIAALITGTGVYYLLISQKSFASSPSIDGIQCNTMEHFTLHIHTHLDIFINGKPFTVPSQIGIKPQARCLYWLHTHDNSGVIHIESPQKKEFTLGQFFDIWNEKFSNSQILNYTVSGNSNSVLSVYVNGHKVTDMNYRDVKLNAHDEISIVYSNPPSTIPSKYNFPQGL